MRPLVSTATACRRKRKRQADSPNRASARRQLACKALGVSWGAQATEVRAAYLRHAVLAHPSRGGCIHQFEGVVAAYEVLTGGHAELPPQPCDGLAMPTSGLRATVATTAVSPSRRGNADLCRRALHRLHRALAGVPREQRRSSLERLPSGVRTALLAFMEEQKSQSTALITKGCKIQSATSQFGCAAADTARDGSTAGASTAQTHRSGYRGIRCRQGKYQAFTMVLRLSIATRTDPSLEVAVRFHAVLVRARQLILEGVAPGVDTEPSAKNDGLFRAAISEACSENSMDEASLGLSFCASLPAGPLVGRVIFGRFSPDLHAVLAQQHRLDEARALGWLGVRAAWLELLQDPACPRANAFGRGRARPAGGQEAARIVDAAWQAHAPSRQRAEEHRMRMAEREQREALRTATCASEVVRAARAVARFTTKSSVPRFAGLRRLKVSDRKQVPKRDKMMSRSSNGIAHASRSFTGSAPKLTRSCRSKRMRQARGTSALTSF
eukprot:gnl/TRDRNA2_/TRDRNA2_164688_c0_seq3.p1 gnl/TRDRNA2_/TRDRNA2_164688_c0~~gnl/TRDRNA2_/TRDRNA2_164688_c0_seq3.p1  ORF type:complete len:509 (+),score=51.04 gnl/TRDRNA2_/TRDRNA2_164688_c0_seq3:34-1527(+)